MDPELDKLIEKFAPMAKAEAYKIWETAQNAVELDELIAIANLGLVSAANMWHGYCARNNFDPLRLEYFRPYAQRRMRGAIWDTMRAQDWLPRNVRSKAKQLAAAGHDAGASEDQLSASTGMTVVEVRAILAGVSRRPVSIDAEPIEHASQDSVEGAVEESLILGHMAKAIRALSEPHQAVLALHYYRGMEIRDVARALGVTESRASHLHTHAVLEVHRVLAESFQRAG